MSKDHDVKADERVPFSLFHAAIERDKELQEKQSVKQSDQKESGKVD